ncbi:MAG TPA: hypothetical protein VLI04_20600, partial [Nocardioidaceae bacterium]|nr:hypothetical protein [Nocardioidaceae bacterium]
YQISGDDAANVLAMTCVGGNTTPISAPNAPCADVKTIVIFPGDEVDSVDLSGVTAANFTSIPSVDIYGDLEVSDPKVDSLIGSGLADRILSDAFDNVKGGAGNDYIQFGGKVEGEGGDDVLQDVSAANGAFGGPGDDRFIDSVSAGGMFGGTGEDSFEADFNSAIGSIDFTMIFNATQIVVQADAGSATYDLSEFEHLIITMPSAGTQTLNALTFAGDVDVRGFGGTDIITGSKKSDTLRGGSGNDTINAQDGGFDIVECGLGTDTAKVDGLDRVTGCENVTVAKPQTTITKGPRNVRKGALATFKFTSSVPGSVFQCKVDKKPWKSCTSPYSVSTGGLTKGLHTLRVRAGFPAGNWDATPAKKSFGVT